MQKIATQIFIYASISFSVLGISLVVIQPRNSEILDKLLLSNVFVILSSFAVSVAGKFLMNRRQY